MGIVDLFFPRTCLGCRKEGSYFCADCVEKIPEARPICPYCKHPSIDGATHVNCARKLGIDGLTSVWDYDGIIRKAILSLKYRYATQVGQELSGFLTSLLKIKVLPPIRQITPVPIYWHRQNTRGFNQSVLVGKLISYSMDWEFMPNLLFKRKSTIPQAELSGEKRRKNLQGVFSVNSEIQIPDSIFLFDDVFTTGSTMMEAGKVLKRAGVKRVWGLTIAR